MYYIRMADEHSLFILIIPFLFFNEKHYMSIIWEEFEGVKRAERESIITALHQFKI